MYRMHYRFISEHIPVLVHIITLYLDFTELFAILQGINERRSNFKLYVKKLSLLLLSEENTIRMSLDSIGSILLYKLYNRR